MNHVCVPCGHQWRSQSECPEHCPGCGSYSYELPAGVTNNTRKYTGTWLSCSCGHSWIQQGEQPPYRCPDENCQRRYRQDGLGIVPERARLVPKTTSWGVTEKYG